MGPSSHPTDLALPYLLRSFEGMSIRALQARRLKALINVHFSEEIFQKTHPN